MFFVHWSSTQNSYRDMERINSFCQRCNDEKEHTLRYHISKTKHYSVVSFGGGDKMITIICHGCLLENRVPSNDEKYLIDKYDKMILVGEAFHHIEERKSNKAKKILEKILKKEPTHVQARFALAKCLIELENYSEAREILNSLNQEFPNESEIEDLQKIINLKNNHN